MPIVSPFNESGTLIQYQAPKHEIVAHPYVSILYYPSLELIKGSKQDMRLEGMTEHGTYKEEELDGIRPEILQQYYGTTGQGVNRRPGQTGAGNPPEEEDSDWEDEDGSENLANRVADDQRHNVRHDPIDVPDHQSPFNAEMEQLFFQGLANIDQLLLLPEGYNIRPEEWVNGEYISFETLKTGRKRKEMRVNLPDSVWRPRAEQWVRALDLMNQFEYALYDE